MKVSVIICCYTHERFQDTLDAVASVESQTRLPDELILARLQAARLGRRPSVPMAVDIEVNSIPVQRPE